MQIVWSTILVASALGEGLGRGEVLQRRMSGREVSVEP
jgi:hypothetical protein